MEFTTEPLSLTHFLLIVSRKMSLLFLLGSFFFVGLSCTNATDNANDNGIDKGNGDGNANAIANGNGNAAANANC